jgi:putative FmdB family regulatory protein
VDSHPATKTDLRHFAALTLQNPVLTSFEAVGGSPMPLYEYVCTECEHLQEVLQKVSDPAPALCKSCGAEHSLQKAVSQTSFHLKGGGWYKDLYASTGKDDKKSEKSGEKAEKKAEKKAAKESGKTEKKAASGKDSGKAKSASTKAA